MESSRQKAFQKLRPPCIELSSVALKFKGQQASLKSLLQALENLRTVLVELGRLDALDEKLAEYAFFPLSNVFNESQRLSSRCLEVAVQCLQILISRGWRQKLQPEMGKQLLILLSLLAGGSPARSKDNPPSEDLTCACFECLNTLFSCLGQVEQHIFDEIGAKTIVDQNVYLLLEAITENPSESVQLSAAKAFQSLLSQISSRVLLASLLPRTVSALTKALRLSTQIKRTHKVLVAVLELLRHILQAVLADEVAINGTTSQSAGNEVSVRSPEPAEESTILDHSWLKATVSQVKLALANVVKLRIHDRQEVQRALFQLCLMICEMCVRTLSDSLQIIIETMVMLANHDEASPSAQEKQILKHLVLSNPGLADLMRNSLNVWLNALPRLMRGNDDRPKQQVLRQISAAVQILLESGQASDLLDDSLAVSLVESVVAAVDVPHSRSFKTVSESPSPVQMIHLQEQNYTTTFEPVVMGQRSQRDSLVELQALISQIKDTAASEPLTRSIMARIAQSSSLQQLSALWLSLNFLRKDKSIFSMSELIDLPDQSDNIAYLTSDLYSITLPLLLDTSMVSNIDWRVSALALESTILQANQLGASYRPELTDTLYPMLSLLGSPEPRLQSHTMTALNLLATACEYPNTSTMLVENADYLINSIALKLNTFDISPQGPQVLLMLLRLCGARIIPYLDDLIGSIFVALDNFHGYPRLVELLFEVLGVVVDEAAKNPALTITNGMEEPKHRKIAYRPSTIEDIIHDIRAHKQRKERLQAENLGEQIGNDALKPAPHRPWTSKLDGPQTPKEDRGPEDSDMDDNEEPSSSRPEEEKEAPLSQPHTLLLSVARSTIPHLSSPSPRVRLTLLQLLTQITPILCRHENSFLPLVNDIWPAILPRLFSAEAGRHIPKRYEQVAEDEGGVGQDPAYVTIAAADTISALCVGAGDFMTGRVEDIFPSLERLYSRVWAQVERDRLRGAQHRGGGPRNKLLGATDEDRNVDPGADLKGVVDLRIVPSSSSSPLVGGDVKSSSSSSASKQNLVPSSSSSSTISRSPRPNPSVLPRTSTTQIHTSLAHLLATLLLYTSIPASSPIGDSILCLLSPIMDEEGPGREEVREALEAWNADAVWVARQAGRMRTEQKGQGEGRGRQKPGLVMGRREGEVWEFGDVVF